MYTAYITHADCLKYDLGPEHPESPARLIAIEDQLIASGVMDFLQRHDAPLATLAQLARVHREDYIASLHAASPAEGIIYLDPDTAMNRHTLNAAYRAAGAAVLGTQLVLEGQVANAFCAIRPPGHHAESARAMGFSFFNNVAVGVAHALAHYGLERIAIVDFDVHQGNGTEEIFRRDDRVLFCSSFQHPFYPYCGTESSSDRMVNVPLPSGTDGMTFREAVSDAWAPALEKFRPQMVFVSAGFDAHCRDEIAQCNLTEADYTWVTQFIKGVAEKHAGGRIVSVLEGGYELHALASSATAHIKVLSE